MNIDDLAALVKEHLEDRGPEAEERHDRKLDSTVKAAAVAASKHPNKTEDAFYNLVVPKIHKSMHRTVRDSIRIGAVTIKPEKDDAGDMVTGEQYAKRAVAEALLTAIISEVENTEIFMTALAGAMQNFGVHIIQAEMDETGNDAVTRQQGKPESETAH
jgi:hypothetical protein